MEFLPLQESNSELLPRLSWQFTDMTYDVAYVYFKSNNVY